MQTCFSFRWCLLWVQLTLYYLYITLKVMLCRYKNKKGTYWLLQKQKRKKWQQLWYWAFHQCEIVNFSVLCLCDTVLFLFFNLLQIYSVRTRSRAVHIFNIFTGMIAAMDEYKKVCGVLLLFSYNMVGLPVAKQLMFKQQILNILPSFSSRSVFQLSVLLSAHSFASSWSLQWTKI